MRVVHHPADGEPRTLATDVRVADSLVAKMVGVMGRRSLPADFALVFPFDRSASRSIHMAFVLTPIDVVWVDGGTVTRVETLRPFRGFGRARCETVIELAPGRADDVAVGDRMVVGG